MTIIRDSFERAQLLRATHGTWIVASLVTEMFWPLKAQSADYEGKEFLLLPMVRTEGATASNPLAVDLLPAIGLCASAHKLSQVQARVAVMRFASALSWQEGAKIEIVGWSGGNLPRQTGRSMNRTVREFLEVDWLQSPASDAARTALALYREGISLDNPFYGFLSLYKAFSLAVPAPQRSEWFARQHLLRNDLARKRLEELKSENHDVGEYLYTQGRHAIAHADRQPFVDPDSSDDHFRLQKDLPLMRGYAEIAIEENFNILKTQTIWERHLYQLEGFRELLGPRMVDAMKTGAGVVVSPSVRWPRRWLLLAVRGHEKRALPEMSLVFGVWQSSAVTLTFRSAIGAIELAVQLDFADERLHFEPLLMKIEGSRVSIDHVKEELAAVCVFHATVNSVSTGS
jgi:hypothetical protein